MYSSTVSYANVYVWSCSQRTDNCFVGQGAAEASSGYSSIKISAIAKLQPNTNYFWKVNPNGYSSPDAAHQCIDAATTGWSFLSPTPPPATTRSCTVSLDKTSANGGTSVTATVNGTVNNGSDGVYLWLSKQVTSVGQNQTIKITPTPVTSPALIAGPADYNYDPTHVLGGGDIFQYPVKVCDANNGNCSGSVTLNQTALPAGTYNVFCSVGMNSGCAGQPLCSYKGGGITCGPGWQACSSSDSTALTVTAASTCTEGQTACSGTCKNLQTDSANCGTCGNACTSGKTCVSGSCQTTGSTCSGSTPDACGSKCVNLASDNDNCGTCAHSCSQDQTCTLGVCAKTANEANACWGNGGVGTNAGRCYDCNADGVVNILDFSCFRLNWLKPVQ